MFNRYCFTSIIYIIICTYLIGNDGDLDVSFGQNGIVTTDVGFDNDIGYSVAIQIDGKILVGGESDNGNNTDFALIRYNVDGSLDSIFGSDGIATIDIGGSHDHGNDIVIQTDGKILITGDSYNGYDSDFALVRYNNYGLLDSSFGSEGIVITDIANTNDGANAITLQPNGKIVLAGYSENEIAVIRYESDGSLDSNFGSGGIVTTDLSIEGGNDDAYDVVVQTDGKIVIVGSVINPYPYSNHDFAILRYNSDGSLDGSFGSGGVVTTMISTYNTARAVALQTDGKIVAAGYSGSSSHGFAVARYNNNGALDVDFNYDGIVTTRINEGLSYFIDFAFDVAIQSNGKIVVVGITHNGSDNDFAMVRYDNDGSLDLNFGTYGKVVTAIGTSHDGARSIHIQSDGKIVVGGYSSNGSNNDFAIARYLSYIGPVWHISIAGSDVLGNGSESNPFATIQHGIDISNHGDTVLVQPGTYVENINFNGKNVVVGSLTLTTGDTTYVSQTVIDGNQDGSVATFENGEGTTAQLTGFTITNGNASKGGGIRCENGSGPRLSHLKIINNNTTGFGGGISLWTNSNAVLSDIVIKNNLSDDEGGGIACMSSDIQMHGVIIEGNEATTEGGGIWIVASSNSIFENIIITGNVAGSKGGGLYCNSSSTPQLSYVEISNNSAALEGGGIRCLSHSDALFINSTICNNTAATGGAFDLDVSTPIIMNSIIYNNGASAVDIGSLSDLSVSYSLVAGGWTGDGNIDEDPLFQDLDNNNFQLTFYSPCIDGGNPDSDDDGYAWMVDPDDQDPDGTRKDMGAYYFNQTDSIPPTLEITTPVADAQYGTEDTISIGWNAQDNLSLSWAKIYYSPFSYFEDQFEFIDSVDANAGSYQFAVPDSVVSTTSRVLIMVSDFNNNTSADTSGYFEIIDNTDPEVTIVTPGEGFSIPEYEDITVEWLATDNIEVDSIEIYYSNDGGQTSMIFGKTSSGSNSFTFSIPAGITDSATVLLVALDIYGNTASRFSNLFTITDNTPPTVSLLTPVSGSQFGIGSTTKITWSADDNVWVTAIDLFYSIDNGGNWLEIAAGESNDGSYDWLIPNEPSDQVGLRLIAKDAVALKDTVEVMGMSIKIEYPTVINVTPDPTTPLSWLGRNSSSVQVHFSQPIVEPINIDSISFSTASGVALEPFMSDIVADSILSIWIWGGFPSNDTITIELSSNEFTNVYGYRLDGDGDGIPGDNHIIKYTTTMLADYDTSSTIDLLDLAQFVQALEEDDYYYELGPVTGTAPYFFSYVDSTFDIEDVMAFVMMWNWYITSNELLFTFWQDLGYSAEIVIATDSLFLEIPNNSLAYEVQIKYDPKNFIIGDLQIDTDIKLYDIDTEGGFFTLLSIPEEYDRIPIPIQITGKEANITVSFRAVGHDGEIISQFTKELHISNIPKQFALHQNFPNPFNPITTIEYDLPVETHVNLEIYDILGRQVISLVTGVKKTGYHSVKWDGKDSFNQPVGSGIYFYTIQTKNLTKTKKMILLK